MGGPASQTHGDAEVQLAAADERGLLQIAANTVEFSHPLVRSAVYQSATSTARREIHRALADALDGIDRTRATWHRAYAAVPPAVDEELADLWTEAARRAATDLAARAFSRAADLTANPRRRLAWLLDAAEASWESGHVERAVELVAIAREATCADTDVGRIDQLRGQLEAGTGSALQGYEILIEGATKILSVAPDRAGSMLFDALRAASVAGDMGRVVRAGQTAARLMIMDFPPPSACFAAAIAELLTSGGAGAVALLESGIEASQDSDHPEMLCVVATAAAFTGDHARTRQLATRAVSRCRETGALGTLARALEPLVVTQLDAAPRQAEASADEGLRAARETEQIPSTAIHLAGLATVAALRGDASSTEDLTEQVLLLDKTHGLGYPASMAVAARGLLALGLGRPDEALAHYESLVMGGGHRARSSSPPPTSQCWPPCGQGAGNKRSSCWKPWALGSGYRKPMRTGRNRRWIGGTLCCPTEPLRPHCSSARWRVKSDRLALFCGR